MEASRESEFPADADDPADDLKEPFAPDPSGEDDARDPSEADENPPTEEEISAESSATEISIGEINKPPAALDELDWKKLPKPLVPLFEGLVADLCDDRNPSKAINNLCTRAESIGETGPVGTLLSTWFHQDIEALASAVPVSYLVAELEHGSPVLSRLFIAHWKQTDNPPRLERLADAAGNVRERLKDREAGLILYELAVAVALYKPVRARRLIEMAAPLLDKERDASVIREAKEWQQAGEILKKFGPRGRDFWKPRLQNPDDEWDWSSTENQNALTQISFELAKDKSGPGLFGRFLKAESAATPLEESPSSDDEPDKTEEQESPVASETEDKGELAKPPENTLPPLESPIEPGPVEDENPPAAVENAEEPKAETTLSERLDAAAKGREKKKGDEPSFSKEATASEGKAAMVKSAKPVPSPPAPNAEPVQATTRRPSGFVIACLSGAAFVALGFYFWPQIQTQIMKPPATFVAVELKPPADVPPSKTPSALPSDTPPLPLPQTQPPAPEPVAPIPAPSPPPAPVPQPAVIESPPAKPTPIPSPTMRARVNESMEIVKELPAVGRWAQRARSEPFAKIERLITGRESYLPMLSSDYSSLLKVLLLDPPADATTRQVVCKQAVRCIPAVQLVPLFEKLVHQDSANQADVKEAAQLLLQLRRESMGPSMSARLEQLISKAGD